MLILVLGGTRSGKSGRAETVAAELAAGGGVTYVATGVVDPSDQAFAERVRRHRERRPSNWTTVEAAGDLMGTVGGIAGVALIDSIGTWLAIHDDFEVDVAALADVLAGREAPTVVVAEEVGLSLHASTEVGRRFVDALGAANQAIASRADRVELVVAGRVVELP